MSLCLETTSAYPQSRIAPERRITTKLMDYWIDLCGDAPFARLSQFNIEAIPGLAQQAFVLDLLQNPDDPRIRLVGDALLADCEPNTPCRRLSDVPDGSLLARIAGHYQQVLDDQGPVEIAGDHAEGAEDILTYRGIMVPFTTDGRTMDYIIGAVTSGRMDPSERLATSDDGARLLDTEQGARRLLAMVEAEVAGRGEPANAAMALDHSLRECRLLVQQANDATSRSHKALYAALDRVYAFHVQAEADPEALERLLAEAGLKSQAGAPFTPIVKLVFGKDYDKTRLSEYAAALSYAKRCGIPEAGFRRFLEVESGGLKSCVEAERMVRRAARRGGADRTEQAKEVLRQVEALGLVGDLEGGGEEFVLVLGRRSAVQDGVIEVLQILEDRPAVMASTIRRAARAVKRKRAASKAARRTGTHE